MSYAPGVQPRGADYLFQGISQAGASVGEMIAQMKQRARQTTAMRSMAVDGLGMDPDQVDKMSLPQLTGTLQGEALKRSNIGQQIMQQLQQSEAQKNQLQNKIMGYRQGANQRFQALMRQSLAAPAGAAPGAPGGMGGAPVNADAGTLATPGSPGFNPNSFMQGGSPNAGTAGGPPNGMDPTTILRNAAQAGMDPQDAMEMMNSIRAGSQSRRYEAQGNLYDTEAMQRMMQEKGGATPPSLQFQEDPVTGARFGTFGKDLIPSGMNPAKTGPAVTTVQDEDGNPAGQVINVGGKSVFRPATAAKSFKSDFPPVTVGGKAIPGVFMNPNTGQHLDLRDQMSKSFGATGAAPAAAAAPNGAVFKDGSGKAWSYTGSASDPLTDKNPANWKLAQ